MPSRSVRTRRRYTGFLSVVIALLAVAALALAGAIIYNERHRPAVDESQTAAGEYVKADELPETQVVLKADTFRDEYLPPAEGDATPEPTPSPTPEPTPDDSDPYARLRPLAMGENLVPVFKKAFTNEKVIAITVDECSSPAILEQFANAAQKYGAKLTLFPSGENVLKNGMQRVLQRCVLQMGFEVENRGYSGLSKVFQLPNEEMVQEIWKQTVALNYVLGVRYEPHFFRAYGGLGENDPRTHAFLKQEGYYGIAHWTVSGSDTAASKLPGKLTPGGIYLFKTTKDDGERMKALMEAAQSEGYRMVTLNDLFGYPANSYTQADGSVLSDTMPVFDFQDEIYELYPGDATWLVFRMQERLRELGYLSKDSKSDGMFGEGTAEALRMFQAQVGRAASGAGDKVTLEMLFASDATVNPKSAAGELPLEEGLVPSSDLTGITQTEAE